jgi:hypothetical protein
MAAGKDVVCEKPMTKFIAEGRAVVEAERRYNRVFQIGTYGRFGTGKGPPRQPLTRRNSATHKIMASGLLKKCDAVVIKRGGYGSRYAGKIRYDVTNPPANLDWDMYCGPAPLRPYQSHRTGGSHRCYWDYEGGGLADFAHHKWDAPQYEYAKDYTSPVEVEAFAPVAHPEVVSPWAWVEARYADGLTFVLASAHWGPEYDRKKARGVSISDLSEEDREKLDAMADPEPLLSFTEAVRQRKKAGGHAEAAHRCATLYHLANIAIRTGRKIHYDPVAEQIIGDEEANRLVCQPMRAPWRL